MFLIFVIFCLSLNMSPAITLLVVMGPSGCGKTTTAQALADRLLSSNKDYIEGDEFHSKSNVDKMSNGIPLTDQDRWPWLDSIRRYCTEQASKIKNQESNKHENYNLILSCSALKKSYRDHLRNIENVDHTIFIHLRGCLETVQERATKRQDHFMKASMVESQFKVFESPDDSEPDVITADIEQDFDMMMEQILMKISK